jgi:hypothetical protein
MARVFGPVSSRFLADKLKAQRVDELLKSDLFREACSSSNIKPTRRQARKWLNGKGIARKTSLAQSQRKEEPTP